MASPQGDPEIGAASSAEQSQGGGAGPDKHVGVPDISKVGDSKLYEFKEQLLLLSTLVATVTYVAGLNLPGGSWEQGNPGGHLAGDPILRDTHYRRYLAFYYCNATALAASLVVSLILIILRRKSPVWTAVLQIVMVLDLLSLIGAYVAGSCRDAFTTIYALVVFCILVLAIISVFFSLMVKALIKWAGKVRAAASPIDTTGGNLKGILAMRRVTTAIKAIESLAADSKDRAEKEMVDVLMLLATFAVTITYVAGLSPPGGFWSSAEDGHHVSNPVLQARGRYRAFFVCNTTSFALSLLIIVVLLERKMLGKSMLLGRKKMKFGGKSIPKRLAAPCGLIVVALLGLMGAYAAGSCREADSTIMVLMVPVGVCLLLALVFHWKPLTKMHNSVLEFFKKLAHLGIPSGTYRDTDDDHLQNTRYLVMLLATLVVTITYQAGLDPPGGLWQDDRDGHKMGHPVLQTTHPTRYKVFFYSNSAAFITSLVVNMMLQSKFLLTRHTLEVTLVFDLFGLVTAYGAGSTRDVITSIYIVALAGIVLVYVIVHIIIREHDPDPEDHAALKELDDKRRVLLLVAILAATLTYQAGLTPPGGFWLADDQGLGLRAGFPVLLHHYSRRYYAFFYCNAASFMASVTLILLLVNPKLYRPGIRCYALYVCMLVGTFGLMGAYAAGSSRHLRTSIYVLTLVGAVVAFIALLLVLFRVFPLFDKPKDKVPATPKTAEAGHSSNKTTPKTAEAGHSSNKSSGSKKKEKLQYLMLLGILAASMTYQTGLKPPGGLWQDNNDGHSAGNPILRDINKDRYNAFFYSNSASFMASIVVVVMLLPLTMLPEKDTTSSEKETKSVMLLQLTMLPVEDPKSPEKETMLSKKDTESAQKDPKPTDKDPEPADEGTWPLWPMHTAILLDMMGLLVAYAAGSTRKWETSRNVMVLIVPVLAYIGLYAALSVFCHRKEKSKVAADTQDGGAGL
nr:putative PGG domain-containing protein [Triticum timopheevii subsp. timopheevii]